LGANVLIQAIKRWRDVVKGQLFHLIGVPLFFVYAFVTHVLTGYFNWSEIWFLQVVHRVITGEILYREVFFSSTPLSVYTFMAFALLFGAELLVGKALTAFCFALTCVLSYRIAHLLGLDRTGAALVLGALLVWRQGHSFSYTPLVYFFLLVALYATLLWQRGMRMGTLAPKNAATMGLIIAGVSAGLGIASKQSVGVYTFVAVCLSIAVSYYRSGADKRQVWRA